MAAAGGTNIGLLILMWAGFAGAATPPPVDAERGYSLDYQAGAGCPDAAALTQAIETRTPGARREAPDHAGVKLRVELRDDGTSTLWVELPEGSSRREFPRAACADAVASMAVIASMVLEADASERVAATQSVMDQVQPAAPPPLPAPAPLESAARAGPATPAPNAPSSPKAIHAPEPSTQSARFRLALSAGALLESAVAKGAPVGGSVGITGWFEPALPSLWLAQVRAELVATLPATVQADQGAVELGLVAGRLHVCPLRLPVVGSRLSLVPCLSGDLGRLRAEGTGNTLNPRPATMTWVGLGGTARAQLALGRVVSLESWLGLRGLTRADTFVFNPGFLAYKVPHWSLGAGLGLAASLP
jgi:hypothetical protein